MHGAHLLTLSEGRIRRVVSKPARKSSQELRPQPRERVQSANQYFWKLLRLLLRVKVVEDLLAGQEVVER